VVQKASAALIIWAGLAGAAGVALAAAAAHGSDLSSLTTPAYLLIMHAAAAVAIVAAAAHASFPRAFCVAGLILLAGASLFGTDLALRAIYGARLFPMAAPVGGTTMIVGWLVLAVTGLIEASARRS